MTFLLGGTGTLASWISKEVGLVQTVKIGARGQVVTRVQEWLTLQGFGLAIDSEFGPVSRRKVQEFQEDRGLAMTGNVNDETFEALVEPLRRALAPINPARQTLASMVIRYAEQHHKQRDRNVEHQPHHAPRVVVGQTREKVRPRQRPGPVWYMA